MMIGQWVRAAILLLSFCGLCEWVRNRFELNRFIAPYVAASGIILVMMAAGMLRVLKYGAWFLYIAGWSYWIWNLLTKRRRPDWVLMGAAVIFAAYLGWHLGPCKSWHTDDFSHWTLAVESLLRRDAFPDVTEKLITFQSYPLGATSFIYYVTRFIGSAEGIRFAAQNFLCGTLMLTIFAHVRGKKKVMMPVAALLFCFLYKFNRNFQQLQVDWLLSYFGIAIVSAVFYERENLKRAFMVALPGMAAVAVVKNSGLFFAVTGAAALVLVAYESGCSKKQIVRMAVAAVGIPIAVFLIWTVHCKLSYPTALESKHAVSLAAYAEEASSKTFRMIAGTAVRMVLRWFRFRYIEIFAVLLSLSCFAVVKMLREDQPETARRLGKYMLSCLGVFVLWLVMIYAMYIFSMPAGETHKLASYDRYMSSGLLLPVGLIMMVLVSCFSDERIRVEGNLKRFLSAAFVVCLITAPFCNGWRTYCAAWGRFQLGYDPVRTKIVEAKEEYDLQPDGGYIAYLGGNEEPRRNCYIMKKDLVSENVAALTLGEEGAYVFTRLDGKSQVQDFAQWLNEDGSIYEHVLMLEPNSEIEKAAGERVILLYDDAA